MSGFLGVLFMSVLLAAASFGIGVLPLSFAFSKPALAKLSALGTGLLLGAALGVIIPEGVETLAESSSSSSSGHAELPTTAIALSLLGGFTFMLLVEQFLSPHSHTSPALPTSPPHTRKPSLADGPSTVEFDAELELSQLERAEGIAFGSGDGGAAARRVHRRSDSVSGDGEGKARAVPLTLGLVMHALADGLALGSSALSGTAEGGVGAGEAGSVVPSGLSLVVFFALVIHKAPTALALTTSLLSTSLSRTDCKRHIAAFSLSTPLGALASYALLSWFGVGDTAVGAGRVPGVAMLVSGGTFLYVATVLRPGHAEEGDVGHKTRTACTLLGMFVPVAIGAFVGHDHGRGA
ncbi:Zinc/iron permease [Rhodofomes roseus]|uniref:Zinc/iron permease n=1 Tax=Rhodofomes roseus TaxID=34475 RepID=A0ABQ8KV38_9APHY|nr:Zinc/iron permease [Rhodofomes roseus]KAH9841946.1 Zinc/iron permease [Rhodofomes roseus]